MTPALNWLHHNLGRPNASLSPQWGEGSRVRGENHRTPCVLDCDQPRLRLGVRQSSAAFLHSTSIPTHSPFIVCRCEQSDDDSPSPRGEETGEGELNCPSGRQSARMNILAPTLPQVNVGNCRLLYVNVAKNEKYFFLFPFWVLPPGHRGRWNFQPCSRLFKPIQAYSRPPPGGGRRTHEH